MTLFYCPCSPPLHALSFKRVGRRAHPDDDGLANAAESLGGRNPLLWDNIYIGAADWSPNGGLQLTVFGQVGQNYDLQAATNLTHWITLKGFACTNSPTQVIDDTPRNSACCFIASGLCLSTWPFSSELACVRNGLPERRC